MSSNLKDSLGLSWQPVGIHYTDDKPAEAFEYDQGKRVCIVDMLRMCIKGKTIAVCNETCLCSGGAVGLCFGNGFSDRNSQTEKLLSTGFADDPTSNRPPHLQYGERFFATPELAQKWMDSVPYTVAHGKYAIFTPYSEWSADAPPELVFLFINPDQLAALLTMSGYMRGTGNNVIAPFGSACQPILYAYQELYKDEPKAILGGFDLSQRHRVPKEFLSLTLPYKMYKEIEEGIDDGCLSTHAWEQVKERAGKISEG